MWNQKHGQESPVRVVLPAGNNFLWRSHGKVDLPVGGHQQLSWRVVPDCRTPSVVEIWLPHASSAGPPASVEVNVTAPDGTSSGWMTAGSQYFVASPNGPVATPIWQLSFQNALTAESRPLITLVVAATAAFDPHSADEAVAPSGLWQIDLKNTGAHGVSHIHACVRLKDTPLWCPVQGRQANLDEPKYERFDGAGRPVQVDNPASYIHRVGTLNGLATGARTVVVGGCRKSDLAIAEYSSAGPIIYRAPGPSSVSLPRPRRRPRRGGNLRRQSGAAGSTGGRNAQHHGRRDGRHKRRGATDGALDCRPDRHRQGELQSGCGQPRDLRRRIPHVASRTRTCRQRQSRRQGTRRCRRRMSPGRPARRIVAWRDELPIGISFRWASPCPTMVSLRQAAVPGDWIDYQHGRRVCQRSTFLAWRGRIAHDRRTPSVRPSLVIRCRTKTLL